MFLQPEFWLLVIGLAVAHHFAPRRIQNILLLLASYLVYALFDFRFLFLLIAATTLTYGAGLYILRDGSRKRLVFSTAIVIDVGILLYFKYAGFFLESFASLLGKFGITLDAKIAALVLPLGLSFYTFRLLSYLFDTYNNRISTAYSWIDVALYTAFFPQISSGPIERAAKFLPRLQVARRLTVEQVVLGLSFICLGLFYKICIADPLASITDMAFGAVGKLSSAEAFVAMLLYSIRLYGDFAGYSAMAIGVSTWFALPAMDNFRQPYFSQSVVEFWTRWHVSLSSWFRDYFFFPLSRSLIGKFGAKFTFRIQIAVLWLTMLLTGMWHGSTLTFAVWGWLHGLYMVTERLIGQYIPGATAKLPDDALWGNRARLLGNILITQLAVAAGWVVFRANSLAEAQLFFQRMFSADYQIAGYWWKTLLTAGVFMLGIDLLQAKAQSLLSFWNIGLGWRVALLTSIIVSLLIFSGGAHATFIYGSF